MSNSNEEIHVDQYRYFLEDIRPKLRDQSEQVHNILDLTVQLVVGKL